MGRLKWAKPSSGNGSGKGPHSRLPVSAVALSGNSKQFTGPGQAIAKQKLAEMLWGLEMLNMVMSGIRTTDEFKGPTSGIGNLESTAWSSAKCTTQTTTDT